jgi:hypothetical protein
MTCGFFSSRYDHVCIFLPRKKAFAQFTLLFFLSPQCQNSPKERKKLVWIHLQIKKKKKKKRHCSDHELYLSLTCFMRITLTLKREDYLHLLLKKVGTNRTYFNIFSCSVQEWILPMTSSLLLDAVMPMEKMLLMSCSSL